MRFNLSKEEELTMDYSITEFEDARPGERHPPSTSPNKFKNVKKSMIEDLQELMARSVTELVDKWEVMGIDGAPLEQRSLTVVNSIRSKFESMLEEEEKHKTNLLDTIDRRLKEQGKLCKELGLPIEAPDNDKTLILLEKELRSINTALNEEKARRMKQVHSLKSENETLANDLDETPFFIPTHTIPSTDQMNGIRQHINHLNAIKTKRFAEFVEAKLYIIDLLKALDAEPESEFARSIVCDEDESFHLSQDNLDMVKAYLDKLQQKLEDNKLTAEGLREKISSLYNRLDLDDNELQDFLEACSGHKPSTIDELNIKLEKLEELKQINMEKIIKATRSVLEEWWQKCFYHKNQCELFTPFYSTDYTDELLQAHEDEVARIKNYHDKNKDLFDLFEQRQNLWHKMLELREREHDPNRFKSKSTNFLAEEKERKKFNKLLPKIEAELESAINEYEAANGESFLVGGVSIKDYMENQVQEYEENVEREKLEKAQNRKKLLIHETMYGAKPATPAKGNTTKRKAPTGTPAANLTSKRLKPSASTTSLARSSKSAASSLGKSKTSTKSLPAVTTREAAKNAKRNILGVKSSGNSAEVLISGNELKSSASISSLSTTANDFNPFTRARYNFANSTFQEATPTTKRTTRNTPGRTPGLTPYKPLPSTPAGSATRKRAAITTPATTGKKKRSDGASPTFKTPSRRVLTPVNKNQKLSTLRSSKNLPYLI